MLLHMQHACTRWRARLTTVVTFEKVLKPLISIPINVRQYKGLLGPELILNSECQAIIKGF